MKKPKWKVVCGVLLLFAAFGLSTTLITKLPDKLSEIIAQSVTIICYLGLAGYLFISYFKVKDKIDSGQTSEAPVPNSPEDIASLKIKRNKIIATIFLLVVIGSLPSFITNNYLVGFTIDNIRIIYDVLVNILIVYFIFVLYKNKPVLNKLFYFIIISTIGYILTDIWEQKWLYILGESIFCFYIIYYIKAQVNRRNYRITNFIILPLFFVVVMAQGFLSASNITELTNKEQLAESDFASSHIELVSKYNDLIQETNTSRYAEETQALDTALKTKEEKTNELINILKNLEDETKEDEVNDNQKDLLDRITSLNRLIKLHQVFDDKVKELSVFVQELDLENITDSDIDKFQFLDKQVMVAQKDIQDASKGYIEEVNK